MNEEIAKQTVTLFHYNFNDYEAFGDSEVFGQVYHFLNNKLLVVVCTFKNKNGEKKSINFEFNDKNLYDNNAEEIRHIRKLFGIEFNK